MHNPMNASPAIVKTNDSISYLFRILYPMVKKTSAAKTPKTNRLMDSSVFPIPNKGAAFPNTVIVMMEWQML